MMISRRNFLAVAGAAAAAAALTACGGSSSSTSTASSTASSAASEAGSEAASKITKVALTCDTGTIDDESFNQACWSAVSSYMGDDCQYYIPEADASDEDRETMIRQAVNDGAEVIVCVGYLYGASLAWAAEQYPDVKFVAIDVTQGDIGTDEIPSNCYCITFKEEQAGYLAGYAIAKDGKTKLGFLGGMAVPAVIRYGYGFVQGADADDGAFRGELPQNLHGVFHFLPGKKIRFVKQDERRCSAAADECKVALHAPGVEVRSRLRHYGHDIHIGSQYLFRAAFPWSFAGKTGLARENGAYDGFVSRFSRINRHPVSNSGQFRIRGRIMPEFAADDGVHIFPAVQKSSEVDFRFPDETPRHPAWFGNGVESALKMVVPA